jgi:hypothetical protein
VDEVGDEAGFSDEVFLELRDGGVFFADEFYGDVFAEVARAALECLVNESHAAFSDLTSQLIV